MLILSGRHRFNYYESRLIVSVKYCGFDTRDSRPFNLNSSYGVDKETACSSWRRVVYFEEFKISRLDDCACDLTYKAGGLFQLYRYL